MRRISIFGLAIAIPLFFLTPEHSEATIHTIFQSGTSFSPLGTIVHAGDTVRWMDNLGTHTTTSDASSPKSWNSGTMVAGQHFDVVFTAADGAGPFPLHCVFHQIFGMVDTIHVAHASCCVGKRGNVDGTGIVDLRDLSALISYLTGGPFIPPCSDAANIDGVGIIDLADISSLVNYLTGGSFVLPNCP